MLHNPLHLEAIDEPAHLHGIRKEGAIERDERVLLLCDALPNPALHLGPHKLGDAVAPKDHLEDVRRDVGQIVHDGIQLEVWMLHDVLLGEFELAANEDPLLKLNAARLSFLPLLHEKRRELVDRKRGKHRREGRKLCILDVHPQRFPPRQQLVQPHGDGAAERQEFLGVVVAGHEDAGVPVVYNVKLDHLNLGELLQNDEGGLELVFPFDVAVVAGDARHLHLLPGYAGTFVAHTFLFRKLLLVYVSEPR